MFVAIALTLIIIVSIAIGRLKSTESLKERFASLGDMTGMHKDFIVSKVGPPNGISKLPNGELLQWMQGGYHIAVLFDVNDVFSLVQHQFST